MASIETSTAVVQRNGTDLLPHDVKEIEAVSSYANKQEKKMEKLTNDVDTMSKLRRIWDSKVPEKDKRFYYRFTLTESNREEVKAEIKKYLEFYQHMSTVVRKIKNNEGVEDEDENIYIIILELYKNLTDLATLAETGKKTTGSSIVSEQHSEFIANHEKLENMIKRVECVSLKQSWKNATTGLKQSLKAIDGLRSDLQNSEKKYDDTCKKFDELLAQNKTLIKQQNIVLEENAHIMRQQQIVLEDNRNMKMQIEILANFIKAITEEAEKNKTKKIKEQEKEDNN